MSSQKWRLKLNVGKHYLPPTKESEGMPVLMKPGTIVEEEDIPCAAKDKFEMVPIEGAGAKPKTVYVNNLEAREEEEGKWRVIHKKTGVAVHEDLLTKGEAEEILGQPIVEKEKKKPKPTRTTKGKR